MLQVFSFNHIRLQTQRLCNRVGIKSHSSRAPARHLDSAHPQVKAVKTFVSKCEENYARGLSVTLIKFGQLCMNIKNEFFTSRWSMLVR